MCFELSQSIVRRRLAQSKEMSTGVEQFYASRNELFEFHLTSGVDDMWPKLKEYLSESILIKP